MNTAVSGIVTRIDGRRSTVALDGGAAALSCELGRDLRRKTGRARLAVGDHVDVRLAPAAVEGVIESVHPRRTKLSRASPAARPGAPSDGEHVIAANVDRLAIVASARDPDWRPGFVDRLMCAAAKGSLEPLVVVNKVDLAANDPALFDRVRRDVEVFRTLAPVFETSARTGHGLPALRAALDGHLSVFAGQSGTGKSSLVNALEPGLELRTREISRATGKGRHTTTSVQLLALRGGGFILDTPGVRAFSFYDLDPRELGGLFGDIAAVAPSCRFRDCLHLDEPECAVRYAAESGALDARRYDSYRRILASLERDAREEHAP